MSSQSLRKKSNIDNVKADKDKDKDKGDNAKVDKGAASSLFETDTGDKEALCISCKNTVKKDDKGLKCDICTNWYHIQCQGINNEQYNIMSKEIKCMHWFCKNCEDDTLSTGRVIHALKIRREKLRQKLLN